MKTPITSVSYIYSAMLKLGGKGTRNQITDQLFKDHPDLYEDRLEYYGSDKRTRQLIASQVGSVILHSMLGKRKFPCALSVSGTGGSSDPFVYAIEIEEVEETEIEDVEETESEIEMIAKVEEKYNRNKIEKAALSKLSFNDQTRYKDFWIVSKRLNEIVGSQLFEVCHTNSIFEHGSNSIHPDNLQILIGYLNRSKNKTSSNRLNLTMQTYHIKEAIRAFRALDPISDDESKVLDRALHLLGQIYSI